MRSEKEMFDLILSIANADERVRAVVMNGSRANPDTPRDDYQDYDIIYVVNELESFTDNHSWIDIFGERLMLQMPEAMRYPSGEGHFTYLMLFKDYNRIDLTLIPLDKLELIGTDSQSITLLDKDKILPTFPPANDSDYHVKPPSELFFLSCCNEFWWCLQNVAKGIARDELPYAMLMFHNIVREELHDMIAWYIGTQEKKSVSSGKMGKYFKKHLTPELYDMYVKTYCGGNYESLWAAIFTTCKLFRFVAEVVAKNYGYIYNKQDDENMMHYLNKLKTKHF